MNSLPLIERTSADFSLEAFSDCLSERSQPVVGVVRTEQLNRTGSEGGDNEALSLAEEVLRSFL